jgi:RNA polymerase sigma factor (sigma-70 family)
MAVAGEYAPRWPDRIRTLGGDLVAAQDGDSRQALRGQLWVLLHLGLSRFLSFHASRSGGPTREDLEDIASQKALDLLAAVESGAWVLAGREGPEIAGYLAAVARNGIVDHARRAGRRREVAEPDESGDRTAGERTSTAVERPESGIERREFARALAACVDALAPRARTIWFFRTFYELPSKRIATHPEIGLKPAHVDVILQRCREAVRECMQRKGQSAAELPPGTFLELWRMFHAEGSAPIPAEASIDARR